MSATRQNGRVTKDQVLMRVRGEQMIALVTQMGYQPRPEGREWKMLCPFHQDHHPSLCINPHKGSSGVFCCFSCGYASDLFGFVAAVRGFGTDPKKSFRLSLDYIAELTGLGGSGDHSGGPATMVEPREVSASAAPDLMEPMEVLGFLKSFRAAALEPAPYLNDLGVSRAALEAMDGCVAPCRREDGRFVPRGGVCLVVPQRSADGELLSVRFRSLEKKKPGERTRRWSLDIREGDRQLRGTRAGLMAPAWVFESPPAPGQMTIVVEGETDLAAGLTMMGPWGTAWEEWPARWIGLPGAGSCHEMLGPAVVGTTAWTFTDRDHAGRAAVFDRPRRLCPVCGRGASGERCPSCKGPTSPDRSQPSLPGLLSKWREAKIVGLAAFPPELEGRKPDLRELVRMGWDWTRLDAHILETATADHRGTR